MGLPAIEFRDALISDDGKYRYWLERRWGGATADSLMVVWCMLNPSTADASVDDATIRRCIGFTDSWGYRRLAVVNLYAYRATKPRDLIGLTTDECVGLNNPHWLWQWVRNPATDRLVCAWGGNRFTRLELPAAIRGTPRYALGFTKDNEPLHPLYLPANTRLVRVLE